MLFSSANGKITAQSYPQKGLGPSTWVFIMWRDPSPDCHQSRLWAGRGYWLPSKLARGKFLCHLARIWMSVKISVTKVVEILYLLNPKDLLRSNLQVLWIVTLFFLYQEGESKAQQEVWLWLHPRENDRDEAESFVRGKMRAKGPIMHSSEKHCRTPGRDIGSGSRSRTRRGRFLPCAVLD